jgi:hypothetical protein
MAIGRKTGGRAKGTPNKKTLEVQERLAEMGCDPIEGMARIALDESNPPELRGKMFAELAQYLHPKRRATEIKTDTGPQVRFFINTEPPSKPAGGLEYMEIDGNVMPSPAQRC